MTNGIKYSKRNPYVPGSLDSLEWEANNAGRKAAIAANVSLFFMLVALTVMIISIIWP